MSFFLTKGGYPGIFWNITMQGLRPLAKLRTAEHSAEENILNNYNGIIQRSDVLRLHLQLLQAHLRKIWSVKIETAVFSVVSFLANDCEPESVHCVLLVRR